MATHDDPTRRLLTALTNIEGAAQGNVERSRQLQHRARHLRERLQAGAGGLCAGTSSHTMSARISWSDGWSRCKAAMISWFCVLPTTTVSTLSAGASASDPTRRVSLCSRICPRRRLVTPAGRHPTASTSQRPRRAHPRICAANSGAGNNPEAVLRGDGRTGQTPAQHPYRAHGEHSSLCSLSSALLTLQCPADTLCGQSTPPLW